MNRDIERFSKKIEADPNGGCWLWSAHTDAWGYGRFKLGGRAALAHRVSMLFFADVSVPSDKVIDHKCRVTSCVNPAHLRIVTPSENSKINPQEGRLSIFGREPLRGWKK